MNTTAAETHVDTEPAAIRAWSEGRTIYVELHDGRIVGFPADRFRILSKATDYDCTLLPHRSSGWIWRDGTGGGHGYARVVDRWRH